MAKLAAKEWKERQTTAAHGGWRCQSGRGELVDLGQDGGGHEHPAGNSSPRMIFVVPASSRRAVGFAP